MREKLRKQSIYKLTMPRASAYRSSIFTIFICGTDPGGSSSNRIISGVTTCKSLRAICLAYKKRSGRCGPQNHRIIGYIHTQPTQPTTPTSQIPKSVIQARVQTKTCIFRTPADFLFIFIFSGNIGEHTKRLTTFPVAYLKNIFS